MVDKTAPSPAKKKLTLKNTGLLVGSTKKEILKKQNIGEGNNSFQDNKYAKTSQNIFTNKQNTVEANHNLTISEVNNRINILKDNNQDINSISNTEKFLNDSFTNKYTTINSKKVITEEKKLGTSSDDKKTEKNQSQRDATDSPTKFSKHLKNKNHNNFENSFNIKQNKNISYKKSEYKLKKSEIYQTLNDNDVEFQKTSRSRSVKNNKKSKNQNSKISRTVAISDKITVKSLAGLMSEKPHTVISELLKLGVEAKDSSLVEQDTAELIVTSLGHIAQIVNKVNIESIIAKDLNKSELKSRSPIVTVMGHVDHGKTSLLDAIRKSDVASKEAGGITQHIGAYQVFLNDKNFITFLDTPGHEAFTKMRVRGAKVTDIVVLVVAADDGIKEQTIESINHSKQANIPIIVAINKIDKPDANIEKVKNELLKYDLIPESLGGNVITVGVSALQKTNLEELKESILLLAEMLDLKGNYDHTTSAGIIIESRLDSRKGVVATVIVQQGILKKGDIVVSGDSYGKIKHMNDYQTNEIKDATINTPVQILGLNNVPKPGNKFAVVKNEKQAREIINAQKENQIEAERDFTNIEDLFLNAANEILELLIIVKADVYGSLEAVISCIDNKFDKIKIKIIHSAVGAITESDVLLAQTSKAIILGFNVRAVPKATQAAKKYSTDIRYYSIVYHLIEDVESIVNGMIEPIKHEEYLGSAEIRKVFNISKIGKIAGCYVTKGVIKRNSKGKVIRDNLVIFEGNIKTLKRFKENVKEVKETFECGIALENFSDLQVGDIIESVIIIEKEESK